MESTATPQLAVALVSMPWPLVNRPSLQLAILKSYVEEKSTCNVTCHHPYLQIAKAVGIDTYARIARSGWAGEALFAPLLFPEMRYQAKRLFRQSLSKKDPANDDFEKLVDCIDRSISVWLATMRIEDCHLLGLSVCFFQLLPSLYLASRIKEKHPQLPIVFGGSSCSGEVGASIFTTFPQIDYLIRGEGEVSLLHLCRHLVGLEKSLPGEVLSRHTPTQKDKETPKITLNDLPFPNYGPYFKEMNALFADQSFIPVLPLEFSRGCWWNRCSFCNLNLQWQDYRFKSADRMVAETTYLAKTHACLQFAFVDNALPLQEADRFFANMPGTGMDFDFFAEIRGNFSKPQLDMYSQGGLKKVQVGIEALSGTLLKRMVKGTTVMDNIAAMKMAGSCSIHLEGNLITEFPGTTALEIAETLTNLDYLLPFTPLQAATFFLGYGSPMHETPKAFAIQAILPHGKNQKLYPRKTLGGLAMLCNSYRGDRAQQQKLWKPVTEKLRAWQNFHQQRKNKATPPLHYRDGNTFLIISQEQMNGSTLLHRLRGLSREIYLFCRKPRRDAEVLAAFPTITAAILENFLCEMSGKRLMFREGNRVLSLAIPHCMYKTR